jgi:N-acetylglutamate synthase/N-acetylornithine aminotransferase
VELVADTFAVDSDPIHLCDVPGFKTGVAQGETPEGGLGFAVIVCENEGGTGTAIFTNNKNRGPAVTVSSPRAMAGKLRGAVLECGDASSICGSKGESDAIELVSLVEAGTGVSQAQLIVASCGPVAIPLNMDAAKAAVTAASADVAQSGKSVMDAVFAQGGAECTKASVTGEIEGKPFRIAGISRLVGPGTTESANIFAFVATDVAVDGGCLREVLLPTYERTFGRLMTDAAASVNDTFCVLCSGSAGNDVIDNMFSAGIFAEALERLSRQLLNAEAATAASGRSVKIIESRVAKAGSEKEADAAARAIASSFALKAAMDSGRADWSMVMAAAGKAQVKVNESKAIVRFGGVTVFERGDPVKSLPEDLRDRLTAPRLLIELELGSGIETASAWSMGVPAGGQEALQKAKEAVKAAAAEAEEARSRLGEFEQKLSAADSAQKELDAKLREAEALKQAAAKEAEENAKRLAAIQKEAADAKNTVALTKQSVQELEQKSKAAELSRAEVEAKLKEAQEKARRLEEVEKEAAQAKSSAALTKQYVNEIEQKLKDAEAARQQLAAELKQKEQAAEASRLALAEKLKATEAEKAKVAAEAQNTSKRLEAIEKEAAEAKNTVALTKKSLSELEQKHQAAESSRQALTEQLKATEAEKAKVAAEAQNASKRLASIEKEAVEAKNTVALAKKSLSELEQKQKAAELSQKDLAAKLKETEGAREAVKRQSGEKEKQLSVTAKQAAEAKAELDRLQKQLLESQKKQEAVDAGSKELEQKLKESERDRETARKAAEETAKRLEAAQKEAKEARAAAEEAKKQLTKSEKDLATAAVSRDELKAKLKTAETSKSKGAKVAKKDAARLEGVEKEMGDAKSTIATLRKSVGEFEVKALRAEDVQNEYKEKAEAADEARKAAEREAKRLAARVESMEKASKPDIEKRLAEMEAELRAIEVVKEDLAERLKKAESAGDQSADAAALQTELERAKAEALEVRNQFALKEQLLKQLLSEDSERRKTLEENKRLLAEIEELKKRIDKN